MLLPSEPDRWTLELATEERVTTLAAFGFTERQAQFLVTVLLHAGVFVERHYAKRSVMWSVAVAAPG